MKFVDSRVYNSQLVFHEGRQPVVIMVAGSKTYGGRLLEKSDEGLIVVMDEEPTVNIDDVISTLHIGEIGSEFSVKGLRIASLTKGSANQQVRICLVPSSEDVQRRITEVLQLIIEGQKEIPGEYSVEKIPSTRSRLHYSKEAVNERLNWARAVSGANLNHISESKLDPESLAGNIENYIGSVQVPLGLAGPILVRGTYTNGYCPVPIATTEGALISSICRGARACNLSGGIRVHVTRHSMVRAPVFFCEDMDGAIKLENWIKFNQQEIISKANSVSSVARVIKLNTLLFGSILHLQFYFSTGDAAGQNMTTACTWFACEWIVGEISCNKQIKYISYCIDANLSGDKKVNLQNFVNGRGVSVTAECLISDETLQQVLRVSPRTLLHLAAAGEVAGLVTGMVGVNINFANIIAGIFTATGQDIASVHESSTGIFKYRETYQGVIFTAYLPSLVIGTVGGGTHLPTQKDCLELMGCYGSGKLFRLAEIIASACLALDISTLSAIRNNEFVKAHERLGRNRNSRKFTKSEINTRFFSKMFSARKVKVTSFSEEKIKNIDGIVSNIVGKKSGASVGLFKYKLRINTDKGPREMPAVLKLKSAESDLLNTGVGLVRLSGEDRLPGLFERHQHIFGFENSTIREIAFYKDAKPEVLKFCPEIYGTKIEEDRALYAILMEDLSGNANFSTIDDPAQWDENSIKAVLEGMASIHSAYFNDFQSIPESMQINRFDPESLFAASEFLRELTDFNAGKFPELITSQVRKLYHDYITGFSSNLKKMQDFAMTLTHNDFNTRNLCIGDQSGHKTLVLYDWELVCYQNPQHDLAEFLVFALSEQADVKQFFKFTQFYRLQLQKITGITIPKESFNQVLRLNLMDLATVRFNLYLLAHNLLHFKFIPRVYGNLTRFIVESEGGY